MRNMDIDELKEGKNITKGVEHGNSYDLKGNKKDADFLPSEMTDKDGLWTASEFDCSMTRDDSANAKENDVMGYKGSFDRSPKRIESWEKYLEFSVEKRVMEYDMPELMVCCKENTEPDVKDILIDDGVPSHAKIIFEGAVDGSKGLDDFLAPCQDKSIELVKEKMADTISTPKGLNFTMVDDCHKDYSDQCVFKEKIGSMGGENQIANEIFVNDLSKEKSMPKNFSSVQELSTRDSFSDPVDYINIGISAVADKIVDDDLEQKSSSKYMSLVQELGTNESSGNEDNGVHHKFSQISSGEAIMADPKLVSHTAEKLENNIEDLVPSHNPGTGTEEKESGSIPSTVDKSESAVSSKHKNPQNDGRALSTQDRHSFGESSFSSSSLTNSSGHILGCLSQGNSGHVETMSKIVDDSEIRTALNQLQPGHRESSFSAASTVSGLGSYSGAIPYFGSLSVRSDSSATSTRSFAFPVLQSEWNSSPVRMDIADRRHRRKNRSWKSRFCCS